MNLAALSTEPLVSEAALYRRQVQEAYRPLRAAASLSLIGAVLTLLVLGESGDFARALYWFALASSVFVFRQFIAYRYELLGVANADPRKWALLLIAGNLLAGIQWGILGTVLFQSGDAYRQLFVIMVVISYVAGGIVPFAAVKWAHCALAIPAAIPTAIFAFFIADGPKWLPGTMALLLLFFVIYYGIDVHNRVLTRLRFELENQALLERLSSYNDELGSQNIELKHHSAVAERAEAAARHHAEVLASHVKQTLLPVIACDVDFNIVEWNEAARELLGYQAEEVIGDNMGELLFPEERRANTKPYLQRLFADRKPGMIEFPAIARDGQQIPVRYYITPIFSRDGKALRISVIIIESYGEPSSFRRRLPEAA
jgi:PAS domain S-box-containing protein